MSVDAAVERVRSNLNESFLDWDVTESELKDNTQALKDLSPAERNEAVSKLSDDELQHWADETKGLNSPLKADDRRDLLNMLAQDLDAQQLGRAAKAFGVQDMADAVSNHGSPQQKLEFIKALQGEANADLKIKPGLGGATTSYGNDSAKAISQVLASLKDSPKEFSQAIQSLDQAGKLGDVMKVAAGQTMMTLSGSAIPSVSFDDKNLQDILAGTSNVPAEDLTTRTSVFKAAAPQLAAMQGATGLLADPGGYNAATAQHTADAMGKVLTRAQAENAGLVDKPVRPPSVSMDQNIQDAQSRHSANPADWVWFYNQVKNGAPWDYKQQGAQYQDFGNYNFGLTAAAMGIPENIALRGAGYAQQRAGTSDPTWGNPTDWNGPYGDDPADQAQIKAGYDYYNSGLWRVWND
ncbi:MAG: polymorphic toxin type 44 domain-containing protein [Pseudomonadota bacterium]|nr:polymorphic toxin type 44 domain-containing protein [Pseudomonadota bacterium]